MNQINKEIILLGDIHGATGQIRYKPMFDRVQDIAIFCVGDFGFGAIKPRELELLQVFLENRNIDLYTIRGNHDDPDYFEKCNPKYEHTIENFPNIIPVPDYTYFSYKDKTVLAIGGAISIDRSWRIARNEEVADTSNPGYYFDDEALLYKPELIQPCDILITHTAPPWCGHNDKAGISHWTDKDTTLWSELCLERDLVAKKMDECTPHYHYCGHFHQSLTVGLYGINSRILDVNEFYQI